jgi:septal ring factor EnvC (AmiA/AmiB activator)
MSLTAIEKKLAELTRQMAEAAAAEDFERAAQLRNEIEATRAQGVRLPPPGQMGLGTNIPLAAPPKGWKRPKKPHPMTANFKPRGSR